MTRMAFTGGVKRFTWKKSIIMSIPEIMSNTEAVVRRCSVKKFFLKLCNTYRKTPALESLFNEVAGLRL